MPFNQVMHKVDIFSGKENEDMDKFTQKIELIWERVGGQLKINYFTINLNDSGGDFFKHLKLKNENITWTEVKNE